MFPESNIENTLLFTDNVDTLFALLLASDVTTLVVF